MDIDRTFKITFTEKQIREILVNYVLDNAQDCLSDIEVNFDVNPGDQGIKDPLDYSDYVGPHLTKAVVSGTLA